MIDQNLEQLRGYDIVLRLAGCERPCGIRSPLDQSSKLPVLSELAIAQAVLIARAVSEIEPEPVRRSIALAMAFSDGGPTYSRAQIARELGCSEKSVTRNIARGLAILAPVLSQQQSKC